MSFVADLAALIAASPDGRLGCPDGWPRTPLGHVSHIINGFAFKSDGFGACGAPVIRIRDVSRGTTNTRYDGPIPQGYWVEKDDLIVGMDGDFCSAFWKGENALLNQRVCKIVPDVSKVDLRYLSYILPGYLQLINDNTPSVTVKHLSSRTLGSVPLPMPPLSVQRRVAARIDALFAEIDDGEAALARARSDLETWRKALLKAAVIGELTADWRAANPPTESGADLLALILSDRRSNSRSNRYVDPANPNVSELSALPAGWIWVSFEQLVDRLRNGISTKPDGLAGGVPILRISAVRAMAVSAAERRWLPAEYEVGESLASKGDLLFTRYNGNADFVGVCGRYRDPHPIAYPDKLMCARPSPVLKALGDYLELAMNAGAARAFIKAATKTSAGQHGVSGDTVKRAPVPLPPAAEISEIVRIFNVVSAQAADGWEDAAFLSETSATLRQSILAATFRGNLA